MATDRYEPDAVLEKANEFLAELQESSEPNTHKLEGQLARQIEQVAEARTVARKDIEAQASYRGFRRNQLLLTYGALRAVEYKLAQALATLLKTGKFDGND